MFTDRTIVEEIKSLRINVDDFEYVSRLAKGQFGEVNLVISSLKRFIGT